MTTRWWTEQTGDTKISATPSPLVFLTTTNTWVGSTALISSWNPMRYLAIHWSGTRRWPFILHSCPCSTASSTIKRMVIEKHSLDFNAKSLQPFCLKMEMVLTLTSPERRRLWGLLGVTLSRQFLKPARNESRDLFSYPQCSWQWLQNERWGIESLETSTDDNRQSQLRCAGREIQPSFNSLGSLAVRFFGLVEASGEAVRNRLPGWLAFLLLPPLRILTIRRQVLWFVIRKFQLWKQIYPMRCSLVCGEGQSPSTLLLSAQDQIWSL